MPNNNIHADAVPDLVDEVAWAVRDAVGCGVDADTSFSFFEALATRVVQIVLTSHHTTHSTETVRETPQVR
jgi:hypothetical protein